MENHVRIAELQQKIKENINLDENSILFEFHLLGANTDLEVITVNPKHKQSFLYHSTDGRDKIEALEAMLAYVLKNNTSDNTYTIQWSIKGEDKLYTSYFRAINIMDALDKFYFGRDIMSVNVFSAVLNPIS